jgi:hypothetical protein
MARIGVWEGPDRFRVAAQVCWWYRLYLLAWIGFIGGNLYIRFSPSAWQIAVMGVILGKFSGEMSVSSVNSSLCLVQAKGRRLGNAYSVLQ